MSGAEDFAALAKRLKDMGETGLQRELSDGIDAAVAPFEEIVRDPFELYPYMPNQYVDVLVADEKVSVVKRSSRVLYGVSVRVQGATRDRQVRSLEAGYIRHPVFGRMSKPWVTQFKGMKEGFFHHAVEQAIPQIRRDVQAVMTRVAEKVTHG